MAIYQIPAPAFEADASPSTAPLVVIFERDDAIAVPLLSQLRLANFDVRAARTPVELFDILGKHQTALVLVDLGSATAGRREFWVALDAHRRGRPTQVMTFRYVSPDDAFDVDFTPSAKALADVDVHNAYEFQLIIAGVQQRVPLYGAVPAMLYPQQAYPQQGYGAGPASIPPIGAALGIPSPFMQTWGSGGFGGPGQSANPADPYAAYSPPYGPPGGAPNPYAMGNAAPSFAFNGGGFPGAQPGQYAPPSVPPYGMADQSGFMGGDQASPFASPIDANPFAQPVEHSPLAQPAEQSPFAQPLHANPFSELHESGSAFGTGAANPFAPADWNAGGQQQPFGQPSDTPWGQSPPFGGSGASQPPFDMSTARVQTAQVNGFGSGPGPSYPGNFGAFGAEAAPANYMQGFGGAGSQPGQRGRMPAEVSDVWTPPDGSGPLDGPTGIVPEMAYKPVEESAPLHQSSRWDPRRREEDMFAQNDLVTHNETAPIPARHMASLLPVIVNENPADRALGNVLVEGALLSENKLEALRGIQQLLATVEMNVKLGELALLFKFLSPDQLLAALLVSRGLVSPQQIAGLGRVKQELAASGMDYDLEALLGMFHILPSDQLNQLRAELA